MRFSADRPEGLPYHPAPPLCPQGTGAHARQMVEDLLHGGVNSSEALHALHAAFPDSPLTVRVAALDLMRRRARVV